MSVGKAVANKEATSDSFSHWIISDMPESTPTLPVDQMAEAMVFYRYCITVQDFYRQPSKSVTLQCWSAGANNANRRHELLSILTRR